MLEKIKTTTVMKTIHAYGIGCGAMLYLGGICMCAPIGCIAGVAFGTASAVNLIKEIKDPTEDVDIHTNVDDFVNEWYDQMKCAD